MMRKGVYTTEKEEMIKGHKLNAAEKKNKKDRMARFQKQKAKAKRKKKEKKNDRLL
jgi:hypothetical protein